MAARAETVSSPPEKTPDVAVLTGQNPAQPIRTSFGVRVLVTTLLSLSSVGGGGSMLSYRPGTRSGDNSGEGVVPTLTWGQLFPRGR